MVFVRSSHDPSHDPSHDLKHAIRWWHTRLAHVPRKQADAVRNGLLQDLLALRRSLELCSYSKQGLTPEQLQGSLGQLAQLYHCMSDLSDELSPPQLNDLATAIQQLLDRWHRQRLRQSCSLHYQGQLHGVEDPIHVEDPIANEMILLVLAEWLRIIESTAPVRLGVSLNQSQENMELSLQASLSEESPLLSTSALDELNYLRQVFFQLTHGEYLHWLPQQSHDRGLKGVFRWRPNDVTICN